MGYRTVLMLNNDYNHKWAEDPTLGRRISRDMNNVGGPGDRYDASLYPYGRVVECTHADTFSLVSLGGYDLFNPLAYSGFRGLGGGLIKEHEEAAERLLREAADKLGYRLVKKSK